MPHYVAFHNAKGPVLGLRQAFICIYFIKSGLFSLAIKNGRRSYGYDIFNKCFGHGLNKCMWFGYNPWIFYTFLQV